MIEGVMANFIETINQSTMGKKGDQKESSGNAYSLLIFTDVKEGVKNTQKGGGESNIQKKSRPQILCEVTSPELKKGSNRS